MAAPSPVTTETRIHEACQPITLPLSPSHWQPPFLHTPVWYLLAYSQPQQQPGQAQQSNQTQQTGWAKGC